MADIDNLKGGTKRVVEETEPLNNLRGGTKRVVIVGGGGLPDQTGQSGKFLTTDGTDASWSDKPLVNKATQDSSLTIAGNVTSQSNAINIGKYSQARNNAVGVGFNLSATGVSSVALGFEASSGGENSVAIGKQARATATSAIQLGSSGVFGNQTNSDANTFKVANANGNFEIMSADGTVPTARLTKVNTTATLAAGSANWTNNEQTVTVSGVKADSVVFVSPAPASASDYASAGILCTSQSADSLTFTCTTTPTNAITVNVVCM